MGSNTYTYYQKILFHLLLLSSVYMCCWHIIRKHVYMYINLQQVCWPQNVTWFATRDLPPVLRSKPPHHELAVSWKPDQHIDKPFDDPFHPMIKFIMVYHVPIGSVVLFLAFCLGNHCPGAQDRSKNQPVVARLRVRPRIKDLSR
jgi:hypothetical protein